MAVEIRFLLPLFVLNLIVLPTSAQSFQIITTEGRSTTITAAQLASAHRTTITAQDHDSPATFEGVLLWELLSSAGVELGDKLRGPRMTEVVIIEAADGYKARVCPRRTRPCIHIQPGHPRRQTGRQAPECERGPLSDRGSIRQATRTMGAPGHRSARRGCEVKDQALPIR